MKVRMKARNFEFGILQRLGRCVEDTGLALILPRQTLKRRTVSHHLLLFPVVSNVRSRSEQIFIRNTAIYNKLTVFGSQTN